MYRDRHRATSQQGCEPESRFRRVFGQSRPTIALLAVRDSEQARLGANALRNAQADGAFLVNDHIGHQQLFRIAQDLSELHPGWFIGVFSRDLRPQDAIVRLPPEIAALWIDDSAMIQTGLASWSAIQAARRETAWEGLIFDHLSLGEPRDRLLAAANSAQHHCDVIALDWRYPKEPGHAAVLDALRDSLGVHPLAVLVDDVDSEDNDLLALADCLILDPGVKHEPRSHDASHIASYVHRTRRMERRIK